MVMFWVATFAIHLLLYVFQNGSVLGVGILLGLGPNERSRRLMLGTVTPVQAGSELWLITAGVSLWAGFPIACAVLYSAFYVPALLVLASFILRAVAFDLRQRAVRFRLIWDLVLCGGCLMAAFMQGSMVGALVEGISVARGHYMGGAVGWLSPFALLSGVGLCFGYGLLGACLIFQKCGGPVQEQARQMLPGLAGGLFAFFIFLFFYALVDLEVMSRWLERPYLFVIPATGGVTAFLLAVTARHERRRLPLYMTVAIFVAGFGTLAVSFWPYIIPFTLSVEDAAAPPNRLALIFLIGLNVLPALLAFAAADRNVLNLARCGLFPSKRAAALPAIAEKRNELPSEDTFRASGR
ncbi:cytochrome d ubiquinol oxidase subunit II [Bradyrhizobium commune]|uniref:Cytochrome d ubiquinol oxidase subunit II n=1 Tax=Bradyrhizobium commune TaxID=83627 RepID=A0A7S9GWQ7_9BRAD|nr:cytochrome d ubiquinol oxidase subunit II [Bradyrhizobium commune]QPF88634.1 cytochrome d ubiquinol oxidase subunit II [Bradyrhizobium commune]